MPGHLVLTALDVQSISKSLTKGIVLFLQLNSIHIAIKTWFNLAENLIHQSYIRALNVNYPYMCHQELSGGKIICEPDPAQRLLLIG